MSKSLVLLLFTGNGQAARNPNQDPFDAVERGDEKMVQLLLKKGLDPNVTSVDGETLLMRATDAGRLGMVALLVRRGADPNRCNRGGSTALGLAVSRQQFQIAVKLLDFGARVDGRPGGRPPLEDAAFGRSTRGVSLLLLKGAKIDQTDQFGNTALIIASRLGCLEVGRLLVKSGAVKNLRDIHGFAAYTYALKAKNLELMKLLSTP